MKNSTLVRCCPACGANNVQGNKNILLLAINGPVRQYECTNCGRIWTVDYDMEGKKDDKQGI